MDPQATLILICDALDRNDREQLAEALENLAAWSGRGGFLPVVERASDPTTGGIVYRIRSKA